VAIDAALGGSRITERDRLVLDNVEKARADGVALKRAWETAEATGTYAQQFTLARTFHRAARGIGFFDRFATSDGELPVMGVVQEMMYDQRKQAPPEIARNELREFVCRYFMRVSDYREPSAYIDEAPQAPLSSIGQLLSWCPSADDRRTGFGYSQLYYKLRSGEIGKFRRRRECEVVDVREIGPTYEWLVVKVRIFDFNLRFQPLGPRAFTLNIPIDQETYVVLSPEFITVVDDPGGDLIGQYGFGYSLLQFDPGPSIFAYGPGYFRAGFQLITFDVRRDGTTLVKMAFVANRPEQILDLDLDPIGWSWRAADAVTLGLASRLAGPLRGIFQDPRLRVQNVDLISLYIDAADALTAGYARRELCVNRSQLEREMLLQHFMQHYRLIAGSLLAWRQVPDWLAAETLPSVARTGLSE